MKRLGMMLFVICFLFCSNSCPAKEQVVDVANKVCPVTGDKIDPKSNITYEYQGKIYHFCCLIYIKQT
ncbi:MAG: hypothetical protein WC592_03285 [Candidatus Omnitrophota bacterium]